MSQKYNKLFCSECNQRKFSAKYSIVFRRILCDECYTDINDAIEEEREQAAIDACYSNGEQDG